MLLRALCLHSVLIRLLRAFLIGFLRALRLHIVLLGRPLPSGRPLSSFGLSLPARAIFSWLSALGLATAMFRRTFTAALALGLGFATACRPWRLLCAGRTRRHATFRRAACAAGAFLHPLCRCQANARQQRNGSEQELFRIALHCTFLSDWFRESHGSHFDSKRTDPRANPFPLRALIGHERLMSGQEPYRPGR